MQSVRRTASSAAWHAASGIVCAMAISVLTAPVARGQTPPKPASAPTDRVEALQASLDELRKLIDGQRGLIEQQGARLATQEREIEVLKQRVDDTSHVALTANNAVADLKQQPPAPTVPAALEQRLADIEETVQRGPEMVAPAVSAGEFPGSIRVPGTDTNFKMGGQVRMTAVHSLGPLGVDDRFITSSIPVGTASAGDDERTTYTATPSRLNMDLRTPSRLGDVRSFLEWDFANSSKGARLRQAFIQIRRWVVGQTWSTFSDPEAEPMGVDFEGLNAISLFRQAQIRFTQPLRDNLGLALAIENPAPDLTGAQGVNLTPDFIARVRWDPKGKGLLPGPHLVGRTAHIQAAMLIRTLRGDVTTQPDLTLSTGGFGGNVSGVIVPRWDTDDRIKFASNAGWGVGKYITDLGSLGGQDAVYDVVANELRALPVSSGYIGYERSWSRRFTSAVTYGIVNVENLDIQATDALHRTQRTSINLTWTPTPQLDLGLEFLAGTRVNKDGSHGASSQIQLGWNFRF